MTLFRWGAALAGIGNWFCDEHCLMPRFIMHAEVRFFFSQDWLRFSTLHGLPTTRDKLDVMLKEYFVFNLPVNILVNFHGFCQYGGFNAGDLAGSDLGKRVHCDSFAHCC